MSLSVSLAPIIVPLIEVELQRKNTDSPTTAMLCGRNGRLLKDDWPAGLQQHELKQTKAEAGQSEAEQTKANC